MNKQSKRSKGDVEWFASKPWEAYLAKLRKNPSVKCTRPRPIAYSTVADSDSLALICEENPKATWNHLHYLCTAYDPIYGRHYYLVSKEAVAIIEAYIAHHEGDVIPCIA